jgi:predicted ArsR family transcriptional regulator
MTTSSTVSTREQILHLLKKYRSMSANEIAERLQVTDIAIRKHLINLEKDRLIEAELVRQSIGRPSNVYSLTKQGEQFFPRNYSDITLDFLNDISAMSGKEMIGQLFKHREERLKDKYEERVVGDTLEERVGYLADIQDEKGYMIELVKSEGMEKYLLTEYNCPIHDIAMNYNEACSSELSLFRRVLNADVEQLECKAKGGHKCVYAIKPKS